MPAPYFTPEQTADLYEEWRLTRTAKCPDCHGIVNSKSQGGTDTARTRLFTCKGCGKMGIHIVPNAPPRSGEESLVPHPNKDLGRRRR